METKQNQIGKVDIFNYSIVKIILVLSSICFMLLNVFCADEFVDNPKKDFSQSDISPKNILSSQRVLTVTPNNTLLKVFVNWSVDGRDRMLRVNPWENPPGTSLGQLAYIKGDSTSSDVRSIYRLYSSQLADHMGSTNPNEAQNLGYINEGRLGWVWVSSSSFSSLLPLYRYYSSNGDHDAGFSTPPGYIQEEAFGHAFKRYGTITEDLITVSGSQVTLKANKVAGGSIWELWWNGMQFINHWDYGREIQIDLYYDNLLWNNPTEAGDRFTSPDIPLEWRHGSSLISSSVIGKVMTTETYPLQWHPDSHYVGQKLEPLSSPVIWNGKIGKTITLDFNGKPKIIKWTTKITFPSLQGNLDIDVVTAFLKPNFNKFYMYNATTKVLTQKFVSVDQCWDPANYADQRPTNGGAIITTSNGSYAFGVYQKGNLSPIEGFVFCNFLDIGVGDQNTTRWGFLIRPSGLSGVNYWTVYLVVGTLNDCKASMDYLSTLL